MLFLSVFSFFALFCLSFCLFYFLTALSLCSHKMTYISITKVRVMPLRCQWWQEHYTIALDWCSVDEMDAKKVMHLSWLKGDIAFFFGCVTDRRPWHLKLNDLNYFHASVCVCVSYTHRPLCPQAPELFFFFQFFHSTLQNNGHKNVSYVWTRL